MKKYSLLFLIILIIFPNISFAQTAKDAIKALKKIEAKCQVGIAYNDYMSALGDAKFEINSFLENSKANKIPGLAGHIKMTMAHYEAAGKLWQYNITNNKKGLIILLFDFPPFDKDFALGKAYLKLYSKANKDIGQGGAIISEGKVREGAIDVKAMLSIIWQEASTELKKASLFVSE